MPGAYDQATINQVLQANDIVDVVSEHVSLKKKGREMVGVCPFHDDHRPSLYVNEAKQIFKCFACGAGGSVFTFVQMRENLTFPQAIRRLAERAGIKLKERQKEKGKNEKVEGDPNRMAKVNAWAAKYFQENLYDEGKGKVARDYITKRQITHESTKKWRLGLATNSQHDLLRAAKAKNIPLKLLQQAGLVTARNQDVSFASLEDRFVNRLMFPITDVTGRITAFGGRTLEEARAKYINTPATALFDKSNSLYGLEHARHQIVASGRAVVVEGYTDCIMAHQLGCSNVVATMGTSLTAGHGRILRRYAKEVVLVFDSDAAGIEAANRALEVCLSQRVDIKLASVGERKDPCDFLLAAGKDRFDRLVDEAIDVFEFKWNRLVGSFGSDESLTGRRAAIEEFFRTIATGLWAGRVPAIDRGLIVNRLSKIIGLDSKEINAELRRRMGRLAKAERRDVEGQKVQSRDYGQGLSAAAQREILEVLLNEPKLFEMVRENITAEVFDVPILKQMATIVFEALDSDTEPLLKQILARAESVEVGECLVDLAEAGEKKGNFKSRLTGAMGVLQQHAAQRRKNELKTIKDQTRFLRRIHKYAEQENRHNLGMV